MQSEVVPLKHLMARLATMWECIYVQQLLGECFHHAHRVNINVLVFS